MNRLLAIIACLNVVSALVTIGYYSKDSGSVLVNGNAKFNRVPDSVQVADLFARVSGNHPLSNEEKLNLPTLEGFSVKPHDVKFLEVFGGNFPKEVSHVAKSNVARSQPPMMHSVLDALKTHKISAEGTTLHAKEADVNEWLQKQTSPVFIVHHSTAAPAAAPSTTKRALNDDVPTLSEFQISQYQICLWTAVIFFLLLLSAVCSIANMEVIPDSLLYAKFQSGRTGKNE